MSLNRVQKLLFSEYCDFEDMVLIESPFAQTTREGRGIRQVHLGLTPSKLVLATDVLPPVDKSNCTFVPGVDPDIETFELIAIYPVECVNLSIFRRRKRQAIKAHFCNNRVLYFELGGFEKRKMFWNLWCEKVKFLCPEYTGSSRSETSVGTSSTASTLYLLDSKQVVKPNGLKQLWCKFGTGNFPDSSIVRKWTDRHLYLGKNFEEFPLNYNPMMMSPRMSDFIKPTKQITSFSFSSGKISDSLARELRIGDSIHVNRFAIGVEGKCDSSLFLPAEGYLVPRKFSQSTNQVKSRIITRMLLRPSHDTPDYAEMAENCVKLWEIHQDNCPDPCRIRHLRRYGFAPQPLFLHGLGPWNVSPGARYSIQVKRAVSAVNIRRQPIESELRLPVSKRQLVATISCETLHIDPQETKKIDYSIARNFPRKPVILFWTPDYWYRPRSAKDAYSELQGHLRKIRDYRQKCRKRRRRFFRRRPPPIPSTSTDETDSETPSATRMKKLKPSNKLNVVENKTEDVCDGVWCCWVQMAEQKKDDRETPMQYLRRVLKVDVILTAWDFDSTTLAQQLTMIDRDLFVKISPIELKVLVWQQSSKNAPNVASLVAFAHRVSCLVTSDILRNDSEKTRARLIAKFVNIAYKCHKMSNFHSCRTVLFGLQSPAIYRLRATWAYVRKKHASKYLVFESLCRLYRDPRLLRYQKAFFLSSQNMPYLPFVGDVIAKLLDKIPPYRIGRSGKEPAKYEARHIRERSSNKSNMFAKLLMSMRLISVEDDDPRDQEPRQSHDYHDPRNKGLCDYFKPLDCYEDNRSKCLAETMEFLQHSQLSALLYSFGPNALAMDYLLKARYKEERDNFYKSFKIETLHCSKWHLRSK